MVDNGIVQILMDLLDRHVEDGNVTVQHAALSALRNLAIPGKLTLHRQLPKGEIVFCRCTRVGELTVLEAAQTAAFHSGPSSLLCLLRGSCDQQF